MGNNSIRFVHQTEVHKNVLQADSAKEAGDEAEVHENVLQADGTIRKEAVDEAEVHENMLQADSAKEAVEVDLLLHGRSSTTIHHPTLRF